MPDSTESTAWWRRTIAESVVIILSILLAFAIDAGWDTVKDRNREKAFLVSLLSEFEEARSRIDASMDRHMTFIEASRKLLSFHAGDTPGIEDEVLETLLGQVFFDWTSLYIPSGSRDALFASADIEVISNEELRAVLAAWPSRVADAVEDDVWISNDVMRSMAPYLNGKIPTRNVARLTSSAATEAIPKLESVSYEALRSDPLFDNLVTFRILNETYALGENRQLIEAVDEIIRTIKKELGQ